MKKVLFTFVLFAGLSTTSVFANELKSDNAIVIGDKSQVISTANDGECEASISYTETVEKKFLGIVWSRKTSTKTTTIKYEC